MPDKCNASESDASYIYLRRPTVREKRQVDKCETYQTDNVKTERNVCEMYLRKIKSDGNI